VAVSLSVCKDAFIPLAFTASSPKVISVFHFWDKHYPVETQSRAEEGSFYLVWVSEEASNRLMQSTHALFLLENIWYLCPYWSLCHAKICALLYCWQHILLVPFLSSFCKHCCDFCQTIYFFVLLLNLQATTSWFSRAEVRKSRIIEPVCGSCVVLLRSSEPLTCCCVGFRISGRAPPTQQRDSEPATCSFLHPCNMEDLERFIWKNG